VGLLNESLEDQFRVRGWGKVLEGKTKYFSNGKLAKSTLTVNSSDYSFEELQMMLFANYPSCMENSNNPIGIGEDDMKNEGLANSLVENI
jgi:hypothetical protein